MGCIAGFTGNNDFPFLFVQLANYMKVKPEPVDDSWAELREAQTMALSLPNTGMAVTIDIGEKHHFIYKAGSGLFSTTLQKGNCRLGYLRLLIPTFTSRIEETLQEAVLAFSQPQNQQPLNRFLEGFLSSFQSQAFSG